MFHLQKDPIIKQLKEFFYYGIAEPLLAEDCNEANINDKLKASTSQLISKILNGSREISDGFRLFEGFVLHKGNCPLIYLGFFNGLLKIKFIESNQQRNQAISALANHLTSAPGFAEMLPKLKDYLLSKIEAKNLKTFFYERLNELASYELGINEHNFNEQISVLVENLINDILLQSYGQGNTIIFGREKITQENCPSNYLMFYNAIAKLNSSKLDFDDPRRATGIADLANALISSESFQQMFPKLKLDILNAAPHQNLNNASENIIFLQEVPAPQPVVQQVPGNIVPAINLDSVRETFYTVMKEQILEALETGLITTDDLESQEPFLYMGLPALTLLKVVDNSWNCPMGIRLTNGAVVDIHNCPKEESFSEFLNSLLLCKERIKHTFHHGKSAPVPENDYLRTQYLCLNKDVPKDLHVEKEIYSTNCATIINRVAGKISQNKNFQSMVGQVIEEALQEQRSRLTI